MSRETREVIESTVIAIVVIAILIFLGVLITHEMDTRHAETKQCLDMATKASEIKECRKW